MNKNLMKEINDLTNRREDLRAQLVTALKSVESQTRTLGADALAGKDIDKRLDTLAHAQGKADALGSAIEQADEQLAKLEAQYREETKSDAIQEYEKQAALSQTIILDCLAHYFSIVAGLEKYSAIRRDMATIAPGYRILTGNDRTFETVARSWTLRNAAQTLELEKTIPALCKPQKGAK